MSSIDPIRRLWPDSLTDRRHAYLGYCVSRQGIEPGDRMRRRLREIVGARAADPEALSDSLAAISGGWMFG